MRISDWSSDVCSSDLFYNAGSQFAEIWESAGGTPVNIINNYFRAGPNTSGAIGAIDRQTIGSTGIARIYHSGNQLDGIFRMTTDRSEEHTSELQSLMRISYAVFCLKKKKKYKTQYKQK